MSITPYSFDGFSPMPYHRGKKNIDPQLVAIARKNEPFKNLFGEGFKGVSDDSKYDTFCANFLVKQFPRIADLGISFSLDVGENDNKNELFQKDQLLITEAINLYQPISGAIAHQYQIEWDTLNSARQVFLKIRPYSALSSKPGDSIYHLLKTTQEVFDSAKGNNHFIKISLDKILKILYLYRDDKTEEWPLFLPKKNLVEIVLACPVLFSQSFNSTTAFSHLTRHLKGDQFAKNTRLSAFIALFNMPNIPTISSYNGDDLIPLDLIKRLPKIYHIVQTTLFATPYHNQASSIFEPQNWISNIDPFCIGLDNSLNNHFIMFKRWSKGGLFPLVDEMIADTMDFLVKHLPVLKKAENQSQIIRFENGEQNSVRNIISLIDTLIGDYKSGNLIFEMRKEFSY